ncbi:MAG: sigma 54-interacting transcriptional regulator [Planctomycetota bacterium]
MPKANEAGLAVVPKIGELAFCRYDLPPEAIRRVLEAQRASREPRRFGELAQELSLLESDQVEELLHIQRQCARGVFGSTNGVGASDHSVDDEFISELGSIVKEINSSHKLRRTLVNVLKVSRKWVQADYGLVAIRDSESDVLRIESMTDEDLIEAYRDRQKQVLSLNADGSPSIAKHVAETKAPYICPNVLSEDEPYYLQMWKDVRSNITVPMLDRQESLIGVLVLESREVGAFGELDKERLRLLANLAAVAIMQAWEYEKQESERNLLFDVARQYSEIHQGLVVQDTTKVLQDLLRLCFSKTGARNGFVALLDETEQGLDIAYVEGPHLLPEAKRPRKVEVGLGITGRVAASGVPLLVNDVSSEPDFVPFFEGIASELAVPIKYYGRVIGVLNVESRQKNAFTNRDLETFHALADQCAPLLREAQFFEFTQQMFGEGINLVGASRKMNELRQMITRAARADASVLLEGESGTGKEFIAKNLHFNSRRRLHNFEALNCINTSADLIESELFGHVKGAFTGAYADKIGLFELAHKGTIFLDEIGDLQFDLQGKLLRVLQEGTFRRLGDSRVQKVDVRVIAATNKPLEKLVAEGKFREDLFYRLNVVPISLPPLRQRREDIPLLARHFVGKYARKENFALESVDDFFEEDALCILWRQNWKGNIRELENFVYRLIIFANTLPVSADEVIRVCEMFGMTALPKIPTRRGDVYSEICMALQATAFNGRLNKAKGARFLGWDSNTLYEKMRRLDITERSFDFPGNGTA